MNGSPNRGALHISLITSLRLTSTAPCTRREPKGEAITGWAAVHWIHSMYRQKRGQYSVRPNAVRDELISYARVNDIDLSRMTTDQARGFVGHVTTSSHPDIARIVGRINSFHAMPSTSRVLLRALSGVGAAGLAEAFYPSPLRAPQCQVNSSTAGC